MIRRLAAIAALLLAVPAQAEPHPLRVMTFNIRYGTAADGEHAWERRRELVFETILEARPHVLGVQEALHFQVEELERRLPGYLRVGVCRMGSTRSEYTALFLEKRRFELEASGTFWLSPQPDEPGSRGWDAALPRICTWADLVDRTDRRPIRVMNTHLDHRGARAREEAARLIVARRGARPAIVLGDLNAGEGSVPLGVFREAGFLDSFRQRWPEEKDAGTFNGFRGRSTGAKIDYVLVDGRFLVHEATILRRADGRLPSDHDPVLADLVALEEPGARERPELEGEPWQVTRRADLGEWNRPGMEAVDHALFRSRDGAWNLWACIRGTEIGRVFHAWRSLSLQAADWAPRGVVLRADPQAGESIEGWGGKEWIQAPHVIEHGGRYWMFYGGHRAESGAGQICLATSADGVTFERHRNEAGLSRLFVGPGEARDPMVLRIGARWYLYYTGHDPGARAPCKIYCRTSEDLLGWSQPVAVCWGGRPGAGNWSAECPFVVRRNGWFYLLRTSSYRSARTWVYRSRDPLDFGRDQDCRLVGSIAVAAPEIVVEGGAEFLSSVHDLAAGIRLSRLAWRPEKESR